MLKQKLKIRLTKIATLGAVLAIVVGGTAAQGFGVFAATCSSASDCQQQIDNLNSQNAQAQAGVTALENQAGSYQAAIAALQAKISGLYQQIAANEAQQAQAQAELTQEKQTLADNIRTMYLEGNISPLEILASSKSLSQYADRQQYRNAVSDKVKASVDKITALQNQLAQLHSTLVTQQAQAAAAQAEQARLLSLNDSQQSQLNSQIQANKSSLSQLYAKQTAIIAASFRGNGGLHYGGTGGYPWDYATCLNDSGNCGVNSESPYNWGVNGYPYDPAGWQYRNCTSYAFWRLAQTTGNTELTWNYFPNVLYNSGKIGYSLPDFRALGYTVDKNPDGRAVLAVNTGGNFGHIMYVEAVNGQGQAVVSQYNAAGDGRYTTGTLTDLSGIYFVHIENLALL